MFGSCRRCSFFVCVCVSVFFFFQHPTLHLPLSLSISLSHSTSKCLKATAPLFTQAGAEGAEAVRHAPALRGTSEKVTMCINKRQGKFGEDILNNDCGRLLYRSSKLEPCSPFAGSPASHIFKNKHIWAETCDSRGPLPGG